MGSLNDLAWVLTMTAVPHRTSEFVKARSRLKDTASITFLNPASRRNHVWRINSWRRSHRRVSDDGRDIKSDRWSGVPLSCGFVPIRRCALCDRDCEYRVADQSFPTARVKSSRLMLRKCWHETSNLLIVNLVESKLLGQLTLVRLL